MAYIVCKAFKDRGRRYEPGEVIENLFSVRQGRMRLGRRELKLLPETEEQKKLLSVYFQNRFGSIPEALASVPSQQEKPNTTVPQGTTAPPVNTPAPVKSPVTAGAKTVVPKTVAAKSASSAATAKAKATPKTTTGTK